MAESRQGIRYYFWPLAPDLLGRGPSINSSGRHGVLVREVDVEYAPALASLEPLIHPNPWSLPTFLLEFSRDDKIVFVAEKQQQIVGYLCGWRVADEFQLHNVSVVASEQGVGIGALLLEALIELLTETGGAAKIILEARVSNGPAITLYRKFQFRLVGYRPEYYDCPREDALVMARRV